MSLSCNKTDRSAELAPPLGGARGKRFIRVAIFLTLLWEPWGTNIVSSVQAAPTSVNSFEGPTTSWKVKDTDSTIQILDHSRVRSPVHSGLWSEKFHLVSSGGSFAYAATAIEMASVIEELSFSLWIRADRPGLQLAARVVLPRSIDSETGKSLTLKIYGNTYQDVGRWQQVFLDQILHKVRRQARIAQSGQPGKVDAREAYIDQIMINLHGGRGEITAYIDDLTSRSLVTRQSDSQHLVADRSESSGLPSQLNKNQLRKHDGPAISRTIQYQGEPFAVLKKIGFNGILLTQSPNAQQLLEAQKHGLWLLSPDLKAIRQLSRSAAAAPAKDALIWYPPSGGEGLSEIQLMNMKNLQPQMISAVDSSAMENIFTQISPISEYPLPLHAAFDSVPAPRVDLSYSEIREQVFRAITEGRQHFIFASRTPLNDPNAANRRRCKALRLVLMEIELLTPYLCGKVATQRIDSGRPNVRITLLKKHRGSLVISKASGIYGTYISRPITDSQKVTVPNTPATSRAFFIRPFDIRPAYRERVAGGIQVETHGPDQNSAILLTSHAPQIRETAKQIAAIKNEAQAIFHWLLQEETRLHRATCHHLEKGPFTDLNPDRLLGITREIPSEKWSAKSNPQDSHTLEKDLKASQYLRSVQWKIWHRFATTLGPPTRQVALARFDTLPVALAWTELLAEARFGDDLLARSLNDHFTDAAGTWNIANASAMQPDNGFEVTRDANGQEIAIHLWSKRKKGTGNASPLVIESSLLHLPAGQPYIFQAEVTVKSLATSQKNNVLIFDSGQGSERGQPLKPSAQVHQCVLYRRSPPDGKFAISIMLEGSLDVWIKNMTVRQLLNDERSTNRENPLFLANPQGL